MSIQVNEKVSKVALDYFKNGLYCSEAILKAFNEVYNLKLSEKALKMATGFGTGLGNSKCCCGCITGSVLVTSCILGRTEKSESENPAFEASKEIHDKFKEKFKYTCCRALTKSVEWGKPEHHKNCEKYVVYASEVTENILKVIDKNIYI
ncbi:C-GCAxxG-C-C family (seleno)protein [Clostridium sp. WILCCON 0269]|uniref:C-GCAxxG-C-C family (Seleno)protein n=1 Tax=Candidatus Clostridium eludens TaxID=3381663 RepID=A0ABW8SIC8_9CLOT